MTKEQVLPSEELKDWPSITRRTAIKLGLFVSGAAAGAIVAVPAVRIYKHIFLDPANPPVLPSGQPSVRPSDWLEVLFRGWKNYQVSPGADNKYSLEHGDFHPDIKKPLRELACRWRALELPIIPLEMDECDEIDVRSSMLLIGGPVSNRLARNWQGYQRNRTTGAVEYNHKLSKITKRWRFVYRIDLDGPIRYVDGKPIQATRQAIYDREEPDNLILPVRDSDNWLKQDWLIVSFVPNVNDLKSGTCILDASDLHGQGNKAFAQLLNDPWRLDELRKALESNDIPLASHFQALYRVDTDHNEANKETVVREYHLYTVAPVKLEKGLIG